MSAPDLLEASRLLDALVAEKVFGCRIDFDCGGPDCDATNNNRQAHAGCPQFAPWLKCRETGAHEHDEIDVPRYSTDIADAFKIMENYKHPQIKYDDSTCSWIASMYWPGEKYAAEDTAPMAICIAALNHVAAVEEKRREGSK